MILLSNNNKNKGSPTLPLFEFSPESSRPLGFTDDHKLLH